MDFMMSEDTAEAAMKTMQEGMATRGRSNNLFYYYRKLDYNQSSVVRFLPISTEVALSDEVKKRFTLPKKVIRLRFDDPQAAESKIVLTIPVMQMYTGGKTENDAVLKQVKALYDESDRLKKAGKDEQAKTVRENASYHWMRGEHLAQGFVVRSGFQEADPPENPIRIFELNKQIMNKINAKCDPNADPDLRLRYWPVHGKLGTNFVIKKTHSGEWPSYHESDFSNQTTPWTDPMKAAIDEHGLWQLESFLPERPADDEYEMLAEIVRQSITGVRTWDPDWEAHLKPSRLYRTTTSGDGGSGVELDQEGQTNSIRKTLAQIGGSTADSDVVAALRQQPASSEVEPEADEPLDEGEEVEVDEAPQKSVRDVRSIVNQLKNKGKVAEASA
jgi:hypothetical protein